MTTPAWKTQNDVIVEEVLARLDAMGISSTDISNLQTLFKDIRTYGATGAITGDRAFINEALADGPGVVCVPPGTWYNEYNGATAEGILVPSNSTLQGSGRDASILQRVDPNENGLHNVGIGSADYPVVRDLTIDGDRFPAGSIDSTGHGIRGGGTGTNFAVVQNVRIRRTSYGLALQDAGPFVGNLFSNIIIEDTSNDGVDFKNDDNFNEGNMFVNIRVERHGRSADTSGKAGIDIRGPALLSNITVLDFGDGTVGGDIGIRLRPTGSNGIGGNDTSLNGFRIDAINGAAGCYGVQVLCEGRATIQAGAVLNVDRGVYLVPSTSVTSEEISVTDVHVKDFLGEGFFLLDGCNYNAITACSAHGGVDGFYVEGDHNTLTAPVARNCTNGIHVDGLASGTKIIAPEFSGNTVDILIDTNATDTLIFAPPPGTKITDNGDRTRVVYDLNGQPGQLQKPAAAISETMPRAYTNLNAITLTSQRLRTVPIHLRQGQVCTNIMFCSRNTAMAGGNNQWFALYDTSRNLIRQTANDGATAWAANSTKTLALSSTYTVPTTGLYLVGCMVDAATPPNLAGTDSLQAINSINPVYSGTTADTGLTTTAPNPAGAISGGTGTPWAMIT